MAFQKKTWLARLGQGLNKFILNGGSRVTLESSPDTVTQQGTPLSAENMNDLEDRIDSEFTNVNSAINAINDKFSLVKLVKTSYVASSGEDLIKQIRANEFERGGMVYIGSCTVDQSDGCYILFINNSSTTAQGLPQYSRGIFWTNGSGYVKFWTDSGVYNSASF